VGRSRALLVIAAACAGVACSDAVAPAPSALAGQWSTAPEALSPSGWQQHHLAFTPDGRFTAEVRSYGLRGARTPDELSIYERTTGTFRAEGARLAFAPDSLVTWDRFYGDASPARVDTPYPYDELYEDARYAVDRDRLTLRYTSHPLDAPVETTRRYRRDR
jgi:hypothetical protein